MLEVMASTRPYPSWWTDIEESRMLRRRKSMGDVVLERNLCFVDVAGDNEQETIASYIEDQMWKMEFPEELTDLEMVNSVSGRGCSLVDVVLYLFSGGEVSLGQIE